eukprot:4611439-Amphidinium_carterae.1
MLCCAQAVGMAAHQYRDLAQSFLACAHLLGYAQLPPKGTASCSPLVRMHLQDWRPAKSLDGAVKLQTCYFVTLSFVSNGSLAQG